MRILVVEDDPNLNRQLGSALDSAGYVVESALDGEQGHFLGDTSDFDAVVLDLGLPGMSGIDVLRKWRDVGRAMPVLILTARDLWSDKVAGIDAGADDYLAKPFHMAELLARVRALIRRSAGRADPVLISGPIRFDTRSGTVTRDGEPIVLTTFEQRLLQFLMHRAGQIVGRGEIIEHIYAQDFDRDSNTVEVFVRRLRLKLGSDAIETIRGQGYRMPLGESSGRGGTGTG
ncbi:MAG TPA: response regulator transcription factor [Dongiaceae bacterium]|nr:response regulator transcription factor [Dongiaceae bacterium]